MGCHRGFLQRRALIIISNERVNRILKSECYCTTSTRVSYSLQVTNLFITFLQRTALFQIRRSAGFYNPLSGYSSIIQQYVFISTFLPRRALLILCQIRELTGNYNPIVTVPTSTQVFILYTSIFIKLFHGAQRAVTVYKTERKQRKKSIREKY